MDIIIDKRLRELRAQRKNTQEDLADYLNISFQAVSKWERGESLPDISLLPKISAFYGVSVDDLLGVGEIRKRERIDRYFAENLKIQNVGKMPEAVALLRGALKEFPNEHAVMSELAHAIFYQNIDDTERYKEVIELMERVLRESTNQSLRDRAVQLLCYSYNYLGDYEKAKEYAETASGIEFSKELILSNILKGDDREIFSKELITVLADYIGLCTYKLDSIPWEKRHEFYLKILELIFDDGFYGFYATCAAERHHFLARIYAGWENREEKARYHLEAAAKCAKDYDSLPEKFTYKGTLFGEGHEWTQKNISRNSTESVCERLLHGIDGCGLDDGSFDRYREKDWFKAAIKSLEQKKPADGRADGPY